MSWLEHIDDVLQRYNTTSGTNPPPDPAADFAKVAAHAPTEAISGGLAEAFRSANTPPFEQMISDLFKSSAPQQRAGILNHLLAAAGPAASGLLSRLTGQTPSVPPQQAPSGQPTVTPQQAQQVEPHNVREIAKEAQKNDPSIVDRASEFYAQHPQLVQGLGAAALAMIMSHVSKRH
jgi:hypothetical protein